MTELKLPRKCPDFEAKIRIHTNEESGRRNSPLNGIRWDFKYAEAKVGSNIYIIHPYFIDANDKLILRSTPLRGTLRAWMYILNDEMKPYHQKRISIGQKFTCQEGSRPFASGVITKIIGLKEEIDVLSR